MQSQTPQGLTRFPSERRRSETVPPNISCQSVLVTPSAIHATVAITWVERADHCICKVQVLDRPNGALLALGVASVPDWRQPKELRAALVELVHDLVSKVHAEYVAGEPF